MLTDIVVSFEQPGPGKQYPCLISDSHKQDKNGCHTMNVVIYRKLNGGIC